MKKLLLLLFTLLSLAACKKDKDVTPKPGALADKFAGTYTLNSFRFVEGGTELINLPTLPLTNAGQTVSGKVTLTKKTDTSLDMNFQLKIPDSDGLAFDITNLEARQVGSEYGLFLDGNRVADVEGTLIIFNYSETDPKTKAQSQMAYVAKR